MLTDFSRRPPPAFQTRALVSDDHYVGDDDEEIDVNDDDGDINMQVMLKLNTRPKSC